MCWRPGVTGSAKSVLPEASPLPATCARADTFLAKRIVSTERIPPGSKVARSSRSDAGCTKLRHPSSRPSSVCDRSVMGPEESPQLPCVDRANGCPALGQVALRLRLRGELERERSHWARVDGANESTCEPAPGKQNLHRRA